MKKTYAARGMLEWQISLPTGKSTVRVHFKDGSMNYNGIIPATFTTSDPAIQHMIEHSRYFTCGRIYISS